jgi:hypothetical protein
MTASVASELPALGAMLAQVFEMTRTLDDRSLQHVVGALCQQSEVTLEQVGPLMSTACLQRLCYRCNVCELTEVPNICSISSQVSAAQSVNHTIFRNAAHMFPVDKLLEVSLLLFLLFWLRCGCFFPGYVC